jgi:hypothetical protein
MGAKDNTYYQSQNSGTPAPLLWYASLPDHVKRLYDHKSTFSQQPLAMVVLAEVVCEAFTVWAMQELFKKKNLAELWNVISDEKPKLRRLQDICQADSNKIYTALSGDRITQAPFWDQLKRHGIRRNNLVHPDHTHPTAHAIPTLQDSVESFKAVEDYIQHVHGVLTSM